MSINTIDSISYKWIIRSFSLIKDKNTESICSPTFHGKLEDYAFCLIMFPNVFGNTTVSLHIQQNSQMEEGTVHYVMFFVNDKQEEVNKHVGKKYFSGSPVKLKYTYKELNGNMVIATNTLFSSNSSLLNNDELTIFCHINLELESKAEKVYNNCLSEKRLFNDFASLFESGKYADITIHVKKQTFLAHKCILATRSSVFASMFEHDMEEARTSTVEVSDIDADVFKEFLRYIYTGHVEHIDRVAICLISAADKYGVLTLKSLCMESLCDNINRSTVIDILIVAHLHNCDKLKQKAIDFVCKHILTLINSENWQTITEKYPSLITELMIKMYISTTPCIRSDVIEN